MTSSEPAPFREAVAAMNAVVVRPEIELGPIRPPQRLAPHSYALGGTVTATTSVRYGDISGPPRAHQLELRASWTAMSPAVGGHVEGFCEVLEHAAGLPPAGVTDLSSRSRA